MIVLLPLAVCDMFILLLPPRLPLPPSPPTQRKAVLKKGQLRYIIQHSTQLYVFFPLR
jgi:hypothetical protein